jgi:hypothetical protein
MSIKKLRQKQHRPERDKQKAREIADLKRQNHQLQRQVARVRKTAVKAIVAHCESTLVGDVLTGKLVEDAAAAMTQNYGSPQVEYLPRGAFCPTPDCNTELKYLDLGEKSFMVCPVCKYRRAQGKSGPI